MPCTVWPLESNGSGRYEPSCPVTPVMSATLPLLSTFIRPHLQVRSVTPLCAVIS